MFVVFISIIMSLFVAIQDPIIQKFAIRIAGGYISKKTGAEIRIGRLYISPNFTVHIDQFLVKDLKNNKLLDVEELRVRPFMEDIIRGDIHLDRVELKDAEANLITYKDSTSMNFQFLIDAFSSDKEKEKNDKEVAVAIDRILLQNVNFQLWDQNKEQPDKTANHLIDFSHLVLDSIHLDIENLLINGSTINAMIHHLSANEVSGFSLKDLASEVNVSPQGILLDSLYLTTNNSNLHLDLHLLYNDFSSFKTFVDSVQFDSKIYPTDLLISEFGPFAEILYKMPNQIRIEGLMQGPISRLAVDQIKLDLGQQTHFEGDLVIQPLDFTHLVQDLNIKKLDYAIEDIASFHIPTPTNTIPLPPMLNSLGHGTIKGQYNGTFSKFKTNLAVTSQIGNVSVNINKHTDNQQCNVFEGTVEASRVNVGVIANAPNVVGTIDLNANIIAQLNRNGGMDLNIDGAMTDAELLGNVIDSIYLNGDLHDQQFNGEIKINDSLLLGLDFNGNLDFSNPKELAGKFTANIKHADLHRLNLVKNDNNAKLAATIKADVNHINDLNKANGRLDITNLTYTYTFTDGNNQPKLTKLFLDKLNASITKDELDNKSIKADCDFFDFEMAGLIDFNTLGKAFKQQISSYITIPAWTDELKQFAKNKKSAQQDFTVNLNLKNPTPLTQLLMPKLTIANGTSFKGNFTSKSDSLDFVLQSKSVQFNNIKVNNLLCTNNSLPSSTKLNVQVDQVIFGEGAEQDTTSISLSDLNLVASMKHDTININQANVCLNDSLWSINPDHHIVIDGKRIHISNFELFSANQRILADGYVPMQHNDTLNVNIDQFNLASLGFLFRGSGFSIEGLVNGNATANNLSNNPIVFANLDVKDLVIDDQAFGDAYIRSQWDNENNAIRLDSVCLAHEGINRFRVTGSFYTQAKLLDFNLDLDSLNLAILSPFLNGVVQRLQGQCSGHATVKGAIQQPSINGKLTISGGGCKVNFLNTFYTLAPYTPPSPLVAFDPNDTKDPTITMTDDLISFNKFFLVDTLGHSALVTGNISHNHLKDMVLDIKMYPNNFLAMASNASTSPTFYGTAIASGSVEVHGPINQLNLNVSAFTQEGTSMTIPLGGATGVKKHEFITFVDKSQTEANNEEQVVVAEKKASSININLDLTVFNNAQVKIALPNGLGSMEARGMGHIKLGLPPNSPMSLIGDYTINSGSLALNIQDVLKRNFSLEPGSKISWTGDPVNGTINATGVYQTKAALSSLGLADSTNMSSSNVKVDCMVHLKNRLLNPDITFGIRLPNASEDLQQAVFYVVDTTNQSEMLVQSIYLMVFNSFNYGGTSSGYYNIITNQLNDIISELTDDIDINVNYKPGSEMSSEEMTVAMRKQLFDDRLTIETNFGVIRPTNSNASNSTNIVGDFNLDYKITKDGRFSGQVFNRSNYNTIYYQYTYYKMAPYTQGVGLSFSKSFDTFRDLFRKRTRPTRITP